MSKRSIGLTLLSLEVKQASLLDATFGAGEGRLDSGGLDWSS